MMLDPKDVLTERGHEAYMVHMFNLQQALDHLTSLISDLQIGQHDERQVELLYEMEEMLPVFKKGDGETEDGE
jgi:hypothetical protein